MQKSIKSVKRNGILLLAYDLLVRWNSISVVDICFGKQESTGCSICHIRSDGGIYCGWNMVGEP